MKPRYLIFLNLFLSRAKAFDNKTLQIYFRINFLQALPCCLDKRYQGILITQKIMLENVWYPCGLAAKKLGIRESQLSDLREYVYFKPGIHWRSSPLGQTKPWSPEAIYDVKACKKVINKYNLFEINQIAA